MRRFPIGRIAIKRRHQDDMRVPDYVLKCAGFIAEFAHEDSADESVDLVATGFFVSTPSATGPGRSFFTFVTAKHVVVDYIKDKRSAFLVNSKNGGFTVLDGVSDHWFFHPTDPTVDVAVMPINMTADADIASLREGDVFLTPESIRERKLGIGDDVFIPGLFTYAPGNTRTTPLLRYGNLAMLPDGPIQVDSSFAEVYLIEARSIGGISGSPVFIRETLTYVTQDEFGAEIRLTGVGPSAYLLGLIHGHWDIRESDLNQPSYIHDRQRGVNLGIAVVVPAHKILETIHHPQLVAMRKQIEDEYKNSVSPGPDTGVE